MDICSFRTNTRQIPVNIDKGRVIGLKLVKLIDFHKNLFL